MRSILSLLLIILAGVASCKKSSGSGCGEATIQVNTTPTTVNSHVEPPSPGPDFPLNITISSGMPAAGVTIEIAAKPETPAGAAAFFNVSQSSTSASNDFSITGTPSSVSCIVTITVTSKSCNSNKWTGYYRYSKK